MTTLNRLLILGLWSSALAGVTVWTASQLQDVAGLWPYPPTVARPQNSPNNLGGLNNPLGPWLQACVLGGVLSGVANLTADTYGYQGTPFSIPLSLG